MRASVEERSASRARLERKARWTRKKKMWTIVISVLVTIVVTALLLNLDSGEKQIKYELTHRFSVSDPQFTRNMDHLLGPALLSGNKVTALQNGDEIFPAMLQAIRSAKQTITFETYIYWSGEIGKQFSDALCDRARAGVKVHVLLDWVGAGKIDTSYIDDMEKAGVEVERYHPLRWYTIARINNRTHRKLLVVDGKVGFTGGVGIADVWNGHASDKDHWRDSHYRLEGPAVAQMQSAFTDNWIKTRGKLLFGPQYFPELKPIGESRAQVFRSSRSEGSESVRLMYLLSIASATNNIRLQAAYFVPDGLAVETLIAARKRGVKVQIVVPGKHIDTKIVRRASRSRWAELLDAGIEIYEYEPTMYHCKVLIVDDVWVSVGSTNFDDRSFRLNDEANLNIYDREFAIAQSKVFDDDLKRATRILRENFKERSAVGKLVDEAAGLLRRQL